MIVKNIPKDIAKYESKLMLGFTTRQIVCVLPGIALGVAVYFLLNKYVGELAIVAALAVVLPFILFGTVKPLGMKMEKFLAVALLPLLLSPNNRKYASKNLYDTSRVTTTNTKTKKYVSKNPDCRPLK